MNEHKATTTADGGGTKKTAEDEVAALRIQRQGGSAPGEVLEDYNQALTLADRRC